MISRQKDIYILVNSAKCSGRGILQGVLSSIGERPELCLHICEMSDYGRKSLAAAISGGLVDGLITSEIESPQLAHLLEATTFPLVVVGTRENCLPGRRTNLRIVTQSEAKLAAVATRHLLSCGRFAAYGYVHFREDFCRYLSKCREEGFRTELQKNGLSGICYESTLPEEASDLNELSAWIRSLPKPAALLAGYDRRAAEVIDACRQAGVRIPDDICLVGIDNDEIICQQTKPRLSSVTTDNVCEGRFAARQLIALLRRAKSATARKTFLCPAVATIVERESTRAVAPGLLLVKRALDYISANANRALTVDEVVSHLGVSRRLAYVRFSEFAHQSIKQAISTAHIDYVKRMLLTSRRTIDAISRDCGYANPNTLKIIFRRQTGMTMRDWRSRNELKRTTARG